MSYKKLYQTLYLALSVNKMVFVVFIRVKLLKEVPYTPEEAERAAGMGSYTLMSTKPLLPVNQDEEMISSENVESAAGT